MLKVGPIIKFIVPEGTWAGTPCILVDFKSKKAAEKDLNTIYDEILKLGLRSILIIGHLRDVPEIREIIAGLTSKGKITTLVTDGMDSIDVIRPIKNSRVYLKLVPPTKDVNTIDPQVMTMLTDDDEIRFEVKKIKDYEDAMIFLKARVVVRPTIVFNISDKLEKPLEFIEKYLEECKNFTFKNRLTRRFKV